MQRRIFNLAGVASAGALIVLLALVGPALILPYLPASQPAAETIQPATAPEITGSGSGLIAFESTRDGNSEIYVMKADGSGLTNLTNFPPNDTAPAWSPDGKRIAFISDRSGKPEVYVMDADGSYMTRLTYEPEADYVAPIVWSPDGTRLAVTVVWASPVNGKKSHVYLIPLAGSKQPGALTWEEGRDTDIADSRPEWSPDGKRLAFISHTMSHDILVVSQFDRPHPEVLSHHWTPNTGELTGDVSAFDWSADGQLAYILLGPKDDGSYTAMLNLIRPGEESADAPRTILELPVTGLPLFNNLSWSPDGTRLLFTQTDEQSVEQLYLVYNDGSALTQITRSPESAISPRWSPDGQWIILEQAGVLMALNVRDAFRSPEKLAAVTLANSSGADSNPQWQPAPTTTVADMTQPPAAVCAAEAIEHCTVSEAETILGIDIIAPRTLPEGYTLDHITYDDLRRRVTLYYMQDDDKLIIGQQPVPAGTDFDMTAFCLPQNAATQGFGWTTPAGMAFCIVGKLSQAEFTALEADMMAQLPAAPIPDKLIAFESNRDGNSEIYVMNADGSGQLNLTDDPAADLAPTWSPDGTRLAFISNRAGVFDVFVMNGDGSGLTRLTYTAEEPGWRGALSWSPDSTRLLAVQSPFMPVVNGMFSFVFPEAGGSPKPDFQPSSSIFAINADGSGATPLLISGIFGFNPRWSPAGDRIYFLGLQGGYIRLYSVKPDGTDLDTLTPSANQAIHVFDWSPDGTHIAYFVTNHSTELNDEVRIMRLDGSEQTTILKLETDSFVHDSLLWSPDGMRLLYTYSGPAPRPYNPQIYLVSADGSGLTRLTQITGQSSLPRWSPDGNWIAVASDIDGAQEIYLLNPETLTPLRLTNSPGLDTNPQWQP